MIMALRNLINSLDSYILNEKYNQLILKKFVFNILKNTDFKIEDKYKSFHLENSYSKEIVHRNNLYSLEILSWAPYSKSPIHNHAEYGCFMKVLNGSLKENLYNDNLVMFKETNYNKNDVTYINNEMGIHSIENNNNSNMSYSLHIYFPGKYNTKYYILK